MSYEYDTEVQIAAQLGHEAVRIYCERRGDFRHFPWTNIHNVDRMPALRGALGVLKENHTPEQSHEAWRINRAAQGWHHGPKYDAVAKLHPCMVPWDQLDHEEQVKNRLFVDAVKAMAAAVRGIPNQ